MPLRVFEPVEEITDAGATDRAWQRIAAVAQVEIQIIRLLPPNEGCRLPSRIGAPPVASWLTPNVGDLPPLLHGHYPASSLIRSSPPLSDALVLSASRGHRLYLFPWHRRPGSQVPHESPNQGHAPIHRTPHGQYVGFFHALPGTR